MNKVIVIGNLGRDPEMRYTPNGAMVTSFSVASSRRYTTNGEQREETEWFNCSAWGRLAETCNSYLTKGQQVYVEGRLRSRSYQGNDGQTRFSLDLFVTEMQMLGARQGGGYDQAPYGDDQGQGYGGAPTGGGQGYGGNQGPARDSYGGNPGQGYGGGQGAGYGSGQGAPFGGGPPDDVDDLPF